MSVGMAGRVNARNGGVGSGETPTKDKSEGHLSGCGSFHALGKA